MPIKININFVGHFLRTRNENLEWLYIIVSKALVFDKIKRIENNFQNAMDQNNSNIWK